MIKSCPLRADFTQEAWVLRCVGWEEAGPHVPNWLESARSVVAGVRRKIQLEDAASARAAQMGQAKHGGQR